MVFFQKREASYASGEMPMRTPVAKTDSRSVDTALWDDHWGERIDAERPGQAGRALLGVFLVSISLWVGIILGIRVLIAAL